MQAPRIPIGCASPKRSDCLSKFLQLRSIFTRMTELSAACDLVRERGAPKKTLYSMVLYQLVQQSVALYQAVLPAQEHKSMLSLSRKPSLFFHAEACLTTAQWVACVDDILAGPVARQLLKRVNEEFRDSEDGFLLEVLWAFTAKGVESADEIRLVTKLIAAGLEVTSLDLNYAVEMYGFSAELEPLTSCVVIDRHDCRFPLPSFIFGWCVDFSPENILRMFEGLIRTPNYILDHTKERYVARSVNYFWLPEKFKLELIKLVEGRLRKSERIVYNIKRRPTFPSLHELARNAAHRKIRSQTGSNAHFQEVVRNLEIPQLLRDQIRFKLPVSTNVLS